MARTTGTVKQYARQKLLVNELEVGGTAIGDPREVVFDPIKANLIQVIDDTLFTKNFYLESGNAGTAYPVPTLRPTGGDRLIAFDIAPSGNPVESANGFAWIDVLHNMSNPITARIAITSDGAVYGSMAYGTSSPLPTFVMAGGTNGLRVDTDGKTTALAPMVLKSYTVSGLPSASTTGAGGRAFVTDASATMAAGIGTTVTGGGSNKVPVYSDGTNWIIG